MTKLAITRFSENRWRLTLWRALFIATTFPAIAGENESTANSKS